MTTTTTTLAPTKAIFTSSEAGITLTVPFNPASLTVVREAKWNDYPAKLTSFAGMEFDLGQNDELNMKLLLDESEGATFGSPNTVSIMGTAKAFYALTVPIAISGAGGVEYRPPVVGFTWASEFSFYGVVTKVTFNFTLFSQTGLPKRATLDLTMKGQAFQAVSDPASLLAPVRTAAVPATAVPPSSYYGSTK